MIWFDGYVARAARDAPPGQGGKMDRFSQDLAYSMVFSVMAKLNHQGFTPDNQEEIMELLWEVHEILADC